MTMAIIETLHYVKKFHGCTLVIKLGGSLLNDPHLIQQVCKDLQLLQNAGINLVLVHGGSKAIEENLAARQIPSHFIDGLRVTSAAAIKVIEMVLCGHVNPLLVRQLNQAELTATGLCGSDNQMLRCQAYSQQHGFVGQIQHVNPTAIQHIMAMRSIPVIAPIGVDTQGNTFNINADWAASAIAIALQADKLIYVTDQNGVYDNNGKTLPVLTLTDLHNLINNKTVHSGMLTKVNAIIASLHAHLDHVHIINGKQPHALIKEIFTTQGIGTLCNNIKEEEMT